MVLSVLVMCVNLLRNSVLCVCGVLRVRLVKHKQKYMGKAYRRRKQVSKAALYPPPGVGGVRQIMFFKTSIRALFFLKVL